MFPGRSSAHVGIYFTKEDKSPFNYFNMPYVVIFKKKGIWKYLGFLFLTLLKRDF